MENSKNMLNIKNSKGITLIALVITIIVLIILAGVSINLLLGENGVITKAKEAKKQNEEISAMEKLQIALLDLQVNKELDSNYNENEYINDYLENLGMLVVENIVTVDGWNFSINRQELTIQNNLGQTQVQVESKIIEYLGKNENGKNLALVQLEIKSNIKIEKIELYNPDGTITQITSQDSTTIEEVQLELDEEYLIKITTTDGKEEMKNIMEKTKEMVAITIPYIGTRETTVKVIDVINEENVENYTYILDDTEITTNTDKEYTFSNLGEKTTHKIKVIANYKDETRVESIEKTIETEPRTYLYNNGDQCEEITGGWSAAATGRDDVTLIKPKLTFNSNNMNLYLNSASYYQGGSLIINNQIDYSNYKRVYVKVSASLAVYGRGSVIELRVNEDNVIRAISRICYTQAVTNQTLSVDISNVDNLFFYIQTDYDNNPANMYIYEMWLEK